MFLFLLENSFLGDLSIMLPNKITTDVSYMDKETISM